jgi:hypothetical protein
MSDYFDRLEKELRGAVVRAAGARRGRRFPVAGLATALAACAAVVVVVLAAALIGHGRGGSAPGGVAAVPALARALVNELEILRRPQTATDRGRRRCRPAPAESRCGPWSRADAP